MLDATRTGYLAGSYAASVRPGLCLEEQMAAARAEYSLRKKLGVAHCENAEAFVTNFLRGFLHPSTQPDGLQLYVTSRQ